MTSVALKTVSWQRVRYAGLLVVTALLAGLAGWRLGAERGAWAAAGLVFLAVISWVDWRRWVIPDRLLLPGILTVLTLRALLAPATLPGAVAGGVLGLSLFWLLARLADGDLGGGDVRLAGFIGLLTGVIWVIPALLSGMLAGGLLAFGLALSGRAQMDEGFPYGPALSLGAAVALLLALFY